VGRISGSDAGKRPSVRLTLVKPALLPTTPVPSHKMADRVLGLAVGLAVAFTAVILREKADRRVRTAGQAQSSTGCSFATTVGGQRGRLRLPTRQASSSPSAAESFRRLRLRLAPALAARHAQSVAISSLARGDPGPAVAASLALAVAEGGPTVVLVDAETREGRITGYFGVDGSLGVTTVISGETPLESALQRYRKNLLILPAGPAEAEAGEPSPAELADLLGPLQGMADYIVVHVGSILAHAAAAELSVAAHTALLVAQRDKARQEDIQLAAEMLRSADADLLGVVLAPARLGVIPSAFREAGAAPAAVLAASGNGRGAAAASHLIQLAKRSQARPRPPGNKP
jgi:Mrp family chromosome partitioning ATPase